MSARSDNPAVKPDQPGLAGAAGEAPKAFDKDGAIGGAFKADGAIGSIGQSVGGPFDKDGAVGKHFNEDGAIGGSVQSNLGGTKPAS